MVSRATIDSALKASTVLPLVVLRSEDHPDEAEHARPGGEDPDGVGAGLDLLVDPRQRVRIGYHKRDGALVLVWLTDRLERVAERPRQEGFG